MSGTNIRVVQAPNKAQVRAHVKELSRQMADLRLFYKKASIMLDRWVQINFRSEGGQLDTGKWPPFKLGGRPVRGGIDTSAKLLQDTGRLRASHVPFATSKSAGIGSDLPYAKAHHEGLNSLPVRRTLPEDDEVQNAVLDLVQKHVGDVIDDQS